MLLNEVKFNLRMRITLYIYEFLLSNNYMGLSSLRTTTCDALIVPSVSNITKMVILVWTTSSR